jgi:type IV pilus assembly protein PilC
MRTYAHTRREAAGPGAPAGRRRTLANGGLLPAARRSRSLHDLAHLAAQLANYQRSGMPLKDAVARLADTFEGHAWPIATALDAVRADLDRGAGIADAFARQEAAFGLRFTTLVLVGDRTGTLDEQLQALAALLRRQHRARGEVRKSLRKPAMVLAAAALAAGVLLYSAVPVFTTLYETLAAGAPLPPATRAVVAASAAARSPLALAAAAGLAAAALAFAGAYRRSPALRLRADGWLLGVPGVGPVVRLDAVAQAVDTFATVVGSAGDAPLALRLAARTAPNRAVGRAFAAAALGAQQGREVWRSLEAAGGLPSEVVGAVRTGEESGTLTTLLPHFVTAWREEVEYRTERLIAMVEPATALAGGALALFLMLAMFTPVWDLIWRIRG